MVRDTIQTRRNYSPKRPGSTVTIGIIGGSGLEDPSIIRDAKEVVVKTPYGKPSSPLIRGTIHGIDIVIIPRHGEAHTIMPTNVPYQANIHALKEAGCTHILATTACGSLKEHIKPGDFVFIDQFIDRTTKRPQTFYEQDHACHIPMAEPFCPHLRTLLFEQASKLGISCHERGTIVTIEGPRFSTRAESALFRQWGGDVVNMSTVPEVVLAREAGLHYATIAMSTDYDCWRSADDLVNIKVVLETFKNNADRVMQLIAATIPFIKEYNTCGCQEDIKGALIS